MDQDKVNIWCFDILKNFYLQGVDILYVTGRPDSYKQITKDWIESNKCPITNLYMRSEKDNREDTIVKKEIYENYIKPNYDILFCLEDRAKVVKMWRDQGLVCLQCAEGDY